MDTINTAEIGATPRSRQGELILDEHVIIRQVELKECTAGIMHKFNRYQEVNRCWRKENGEWILKDIAFVEDWDEKQKDSIIESFSTCIKHGGIILGAYYEEYIIGFAWVENELFGSENEYINLVSLQVSYGFRHQGIGRILFEKSCVEAISLGAKKLYISAHSSEETQAFYKAMGCCETLEINQALFEKEPLDCHMEYCFG